MNEKNLIDFCEVDFVEANKVINNGVLLINNPYNVVEKEETKPLIRTLKECRAIYDAYSVMSFPSSAGIVEDAIMVQTMNKQIDTKLKRMYRYYARHHNIQFDDGNWGKDNSEFSEWYRWEKSTADNIELICHTIESWEWE